MKPATASTPSDTQVEVIRGFDSPVNLVWKMFTEQELVSRWMLGPPGWSMPVCEMDFRVGGKYENRFRNDEDGTEFGWVGEFREIETQRQIIHDESYGLAGDTDEMSNTSVVTITFQENGNGTRVNTLIEYASQEARDAALATGMTVAMEMGYQRIDDLLVG
ncbi:SRPBCC domain-containing protein [Bremerella sp.]|uniref:SRPBCC domain-containing protein n=1 Tax=Bremerella sp. TaxID=2795602 RepID=UPI003918F84D